MKGDTKKRVPQADRRFSNLQWNEHSDELGRKKPLHTSEEPKGYRRSDERIEEEVNESLKVDPKLKSSGVFGKVQEGDVVLTGTVSSGDDKRRAENSVNDISGVNNVNSRITVGRKSDRAIKKKKK